MKNQEEEKLRDEKLENPDPINLASCCVIKSVANALKIEEMTFLFAFPPMYLFHKWFFGRFSVCFLCSIGIKVRKTCSIFLGQVALI